MNFSHKFNSLLSVASLAAALFSMPAYAISTGELESNDSLTNANPLLPGQYGTGLIASGPEYDVWVVPSVRTDQIVCVFLNDVTNSGDPIVSAYFSTDVNDTANAEIYNDDGGPPANGFNDSMFCGEKVRRSGSMFLRTDGFGSATLTPYHLFHVEISPNEIISEVEPNNTAQSAQPITAPAIIANGSSEADFYSFFANAGERIVVMIDGNPGRPDPATLFIPQISLFAPDGSTDLTNSGGGTFAGTNSFGSYPATSTGTYFVRVTKAADQPGQTEPNQDGDYRIVVLVDGATPLVGACCQAKTCSLRSLANCRGNFAGVDTNCVGDTDGDGVVNDCDNCSTISNELQEDNDADDVGNACESCIDDPLKLAPGACGCGFGDADLNNSGVADCLPGPEVKALVQSVLNNLKKIKDLSGGATASAKQAKANSIKLIKSLLAQIQTVVQVSGNSIVVTQSGFDLAAQVTSFAKLVGKTFKSSGDTLSSSKKKANKSGKGILNAIA